jgi:probable rRNA maturation factor
MAGIVHTVNIRLKRMDGCPLKRVWLKRTVLAVLAEEDVAGTLEIDCMITDDTVIRALNRQYRGIDQPTDVLSFALDEAGPADTVFPGPPGSPGRMGILVVSYPMAEAQAERKHVSVEGEMRLLLVHGVLHILGYDHGGRDDALAMRKREKEIVGSLKKSTGSAKC